MHGTEGSEASAGTVVYEPVRWSESTLTSNDVFCEFDAQNNCRTGGDDGEGALGKSHAEPLAPETWFGRVNVTDQLPFQPTACWLSVS
jgi:hypothetical protein